MEDIERDVLLVVRALKQRGFDPTHERVDTAESTLLALQNAPWDIVISDYTLPAFSHPAAVRNDRLDHPHASQSFLR